MGEKRGFTGQLIYDFRTEGVCEVLLKNGNWYRTTAREFRSFDGPRRLTMVIGKSILGHPSDEELGTFEYNGPVYLYNSNKVVPYAGSKEFIRTL